MELRDHPLVCLKIPSSFVLARAIPTKGELVYGFLDGWLSEQDAICISDARYNADVPLSSAEESIVMLLSEDVDQVPALVSRLEAECDPSEPSSRLWLFLALAWFLESDKSVEERLEVADQLFVDFAYPEDLYGFIAYTPAEPGEATGLDAMMARWCDYVERVGAEYLARTPR